VSELRSLTTEELTQVEGGRSQGSHHPPGWSKWCHWSWDRHHHHYHRDYCRWFPPGSYPSGSGWSPG